MKSKNNNSTSTLILLFAIIFILLAFLVVNALKTDNKQSQSIDQNQSAENNKEETADSMSEQNEEISIGEDLMISEIDSYSGPYMEDGSDEEVKDILMITVRNDGTKPLQYAEAQLVFGDVTAEFAFSTLRPGESMVVLEKNRLAYPGQTEVTRTQIANVVFFEKALSFCEDKFKISAMNGAFNVENISGNDLSGNIIIYYKNKQENIYHGGITYRVVIEGGIEKDGIRQTVANHFVLNESEVIFVDYVEVG